MAFRGVPSPAALGPLDDSHECPGQRREAGAVEQLLSLRRHGPGPAQGEGCAAGEDGAGARSTQPAVRLTPWRVRARHGSANMSSAHQAVGAASPVMAVAGETSPVALTSEVG